MADITVNGNGKSPVKSISFAWIKDIILIAALLGVAGLFIKISTDIEVIKIQVKELVDMHPRTQGQVK